MTKQLFLIISLLISSFALGDELPLVPCSYLFKHSKPHKLYHSITLGEIKRFDRSLVFNNIFSMIYGPAFMPEEIIFIQKSKNDFIATYLRPKKSIWYTFDTEAEEKYSYEGTFSYQDVPLDFSLKSDIEFIKIQRSISKKTVQKLKRLFDATIQNQEIPDISKKRSRGCLDGPSYKFSFELKSCGLPICANESEQVLKLIKAGHELIDFIKNETSESKIVDILNN